MSYQVLARKWRPSSFSEMAGQEHVLQALINALDNNRLHHAYLFTGTRGVGKTTLARILAKCLNCDEGVSSVPCGQCSACIGIAEGRFVDLIEVDAASRTKVEDTRELLDNVQYAPTSGRYKVYLIDEVHMLSGHSFNALLKTLEEPPPHVKFLLATTDPQKLPVTILSRCLQFNLKNLSPERIVEHLKFVLSEEKVPFEESGLWSLARSADGSMRDALSLTDQAIAHGAGKLTETEISVMLGTIDFSTVIEIANALADKDGKQALALVAQMAEHAPDFAAVLTELLSVWHRVAIAQVVPDALDNRHGDYRLIIALAARLSREDVQLFYQISLLAQRDLSLAPDSQSGFEMALLRMLAFQPETEIAVDPPAIESLSQNTPLEAVAPIKKPEAVDSTLRSEASAVSDSQTLNEASLQADFIQTDTDQERGDAIQTSPAEEPVVDAGEIVREAVEESLIVEPTTELVSNEQLLEFSRHAHQLAISSNEVPTLDANDTSDSTIQSESELSSVGGSAALGLSALTPSSWISIYQQLSVGGVLQNIAANLVFVEKQGNHLQFVLDVDNGSLYKEAHAERLQSVMSDHFGEAVTLSIAIASVDADKETPQANMLRLRAERQAEAVETMERDPNVQEMIKSFDGQLLTHTVRPVDQ